MSLCRRYGVTTAGFYAWRGRAESLHAKQDRVLSKEIARLFVQHHERYGSPRLYRLLSAAGWVVSRRRVARLMRAAGFRAKAVRGYRVKANVHHLYGRHANRLWTTHVDQPNQVWVGDITYLKVASGWRYLAIVMDQYSRRVLAWSLTRQRTAAVTCAVLAQAARHRPARGVIFHSDRGSEYMGTPFCARVAQLGLLQSASVRGPVTIRTPSPSFIRSKRNSFVGRASARSTHFACSCAITCAITTPSVSTPASTISRLLPLNSERRKP